MRIHLYYIYILTNKHHNVLYTGVTNDLKRRCHEHKQKDIKGFTQKYNVDKLIYFERFDSVASAALSFARYRKYPTGKAYLLVLAPKIKPLAPPRQFQLLVFI
jgi:putative endonuclease